MEANTKHFAHLLNYFCAFRSQIVRAEEESLLLSTSGVALKGGTAFGIRRNPGHIEECVCRSHLLDSGC